MLCSIAAALFALNASHQSASGSTPNSPAGTASQSALRTSPDAAQIDTASGTETPQSDEGAAQNNLPFLSPLFSDNMVLQRDTRDPVWGWTAPGAEITVSFAGKTVAGTAGPDGKWMVEVGPLPAGGPFTMDISGPQKIHLANIMMGDVWVCSGQSNMEVGVSMMKRGPQEVANADHPNIRLFLVERAWAATPQQTLMHGESWQVCSPQTIAQGGWNGFSAVAYYYGRALDARLHVPIGLIQTCWSATPAEPWTSAPELASLGYSDVYNRLNALLSLPQRLAREQETWCDTNEPASFISSAQRAPFRSWRRVDMPAAWSQAGGLKKFTGIVWLRRDVEIPPSAVGHAALLSLGPIEEADTVWINSVRIGYGVGRTNSRLYAVPADVLVGGENTMAIRVLNTEEDSGGILGDPNDMQLYLGNNLAIPLAGDWHYKEAMRLNHLFGRRPERSEEYQASQVPAALYNAMVAPLIPYRIAGVVWYQGESSTPRAGQYQTLLSGLIGDWRKNWGEGDFPFYIVQISSYRDTDPSRMGRWAAIREAQAITASTTPNSGLAVTIDIGDPESIHPPDKQDVGSRLARLALAGYYHQNIVCSGPVYRNMALEGRGVRIFFDHVEGGLVVTGGKPTGFEIAGVDRQYYPADAKLQGNTIFVWSRRVKNPAAVRYGWADCPECNVYNGAGLPAAPFRTDNW